MLFHAISRHKTPEVTVFEVTKNISSFSPAVITILNSTIVSTPNASSQMNKFIYLSKGMQNKAQIFRISKNCFFTKDLDGFDALPEANYLRWLTTRNFREPINFKSF